MKNDVPHQMNAVINDGAGGPDVLRMTPQATPAPKTGEVLIKVAAAGINRPDVLQRTGHYPVPAGASPLPGLEVGGSIAAVGPGVTEWKIGDPVCALTPGGGYAEYAVAPASSCLPIPRGLTVAEAATLPETFFTVWSNVLDR